MTVTGKPGKSVLVAFKGTTQVVRLDEEGTATVEAPGKAGTTFTVSDGGFPTPSEIDVRVLSSFK